MRGMLEDFFFMFDVAPFYRDFSMMVNNIYERKPVVKYIYLYIGLPMMLPIL